MLFLALACTAPATDSDPQDTQDSGAQAQGCPSYSGLQAGAVSRYDTPEALREELGYRYQYTATVADPELLDGASLWTVTQEASQTGAGWSSYSASIVLHYRCDEEGVWYLSSRRDWSGELEEGGSRSGWVTADFQGYLFMPPTLDQAWTAAWTATFEDDQGNVLDDARDYTYTPLGQAQVVVPAGAFEATMIERTGPSITTSVQWFAEGVGLVQTGESERVE